MKDKEKQIEEVAKKFCPKYKNERCDKIYICEFNCEICKFIESMLKNSVVLPKSEYEEYKKVADGKAIMVENITDLNRLVQFPIEYDSKFFDDIADFGNYIQEQTRKEMVEKLNQKELSGKETKIDATETIIKPLFDAIDLEKSEVKPVDMTTMPDDKYIFGTGEFHLLKDAIIKQPKVIARVSIFGEGLVFNIVDTCKGFVKPTKKHIKNLKKYFGIDVELMDEVEE